LQNRKTYYYKLEDIDLNGKSTMYGTVSATPRLIFGMGRELGTEDMLTEHSLRDFFKSGLREVK
jgi:hypothetical protein